MEHGTWTFAPGLIVAWTLVAVAFFALAILAYVAIRKRTRRVDLEKAVQAFRCLDIAAFRNLLDPVEEAFLRDNLSPKKFREIKRERAWAALIYVWEAGRAATALVKIGQAAQRSSDAKIRASGFQVAESAFRLRLQTLRACPHLLTEILLPGLQGRSLPPLVDQYERAAETLFRLGRFSSIERSSCNP
ncbi:MAG TPA: hypothetical protein VEH30_14725 [Terriglobales bacterium]|nr:hypothetical protein [Terriglobales bacterium]